jgi:hypothetical protein
VAPSGSNDDNYELLKTSRVIVTDTANAIGTATVSATAT